MAKKANSSTFKRKFSFPAWQIAVFVVGFGALGTLVTISSFAAPKPNLSASIQVSPNPAKVGTFSSVTFTGCGYTPSALENIVVSNIDIGANSDANGCINQQSNLGAGPGTYNVQVKQHNAKATRLVVVAQTSWVVTN